MLLFNGEIDSGRFFLRPLCSKYVNARYASWLNIDSKNIFIESRLNLNQLRAYVNEKSNKCDILFLGIFEKKTGLHIGNIKYEPINFQLSYAVMGILIGDPIWRGVGVAPEVIVASAKWLRDQHGIKRVVLGVNLLNKAAIKAYQKIGFIQSADEYHINNSVENIVMVCNLELANEFNS